MNIEFIITIITIIAGFLGIIKFLIDLTNRVTKLEVEMRKELNETNNVINDLKIEIVKLQHQFGIVETKQANLKTEINELKTQTNERINQVEADNRTFIKELFQSLES